MASKVCTKLPISFDINEALDYYHTLEQNFQHLKWTMPVHGFRGTTEDIPASISGWAIQTPHDINESHCMLYDSNLQGREIAKETPCAFGFAKKLLDAFPTAFRMYLTVNSPGVVVAPHTDNVNIPKRMYKIVIPIQTNSKAVWIFDEGVIHLDAGSVYLIDTMENRHSTQNDGDTDRVHFMFEIFEEDFETVKNMSVCI